jgi:hypothetical protein
MNMRVFLQWLMGTAIVGRAGEKRQAEACPTYFEERMGRGMW